MNIPFIYSLNRVRHKSRQRKLCGREVER